MCLCTYVYITTAHQHMRNMHAHLLALPEETHVLINPLSMSHAVPVSMLLGVQHACTLCMFVICYCMWDVHGTVILQCAWRHHWITVPSLHSWTSDTRERGQWRDLVSASAWLVLCQLHGSPTEMSDDHHNYSTVVVGMFSTIPYALKLFADETFAVFAVQ